MKQKIAITGGSGYIGSSLAQYLQKDFRIKVIDKMPLREELRGKVEYMRCDIRKEEDVIAAMQDADLAIHTAIIQIPLINQEKKLGYEVNLLGTQHVCNAAEKNPKTKGLILAGTWHVIGERGLRGFVDEEFGFRPDKVEERARLYAMCKIAQELIVRLYDEMSSKVFGVIRMGTVLGNGMPEKTAANVFIEKGLKAEALTPFSHSMYRPMLYVDVVDVCRAYKNFALKILNEKKGAENSLSHVINVFYPEPITILELAQTIREGIVNATYERVQPKVEIVNSHPPILFSEEDKKQLKVDISKAIKYLDLGRLKSPKESIDRILRERLCEK